MKLLFSTTMEPIDIFEFSLFNTDELKRHSKQDFLTSTVLDIKKPLKVAQSNSGEFILDLKKGVMTFKTEKLEL